MTERSTIGPSQPAPRLEVHDLSWELKSFDMLGRCKSKTRILSNCNLSVWAGQIVSIVGRSGSGKSSLVRCIVGLERVQQGAIHFEGRELRQGCAEDWKKARLNFQVVLQDPATSLNSLFSVREIIEEPFFIQGIGTSSERKEKVFEALGRVGLPADVLSRKPLTLSGGQRQKVAFARALVMQPKLLILDEPFSSMDLSIQSQLLELLLRLQRTQNLSVLLVTHDFSLAAKLSDEIVVMANGKTVDRGSPQSLLVESFVLETKALREAAFERARVQDALVAT